MAEYPPRTAAAALRDRLSARRDLGASAGFETASHPLVGGGGGGGGEVPTAVLEARVNSQLDTCACSLRGVFVFCVCAYVCTCTCVGVRDMACCVM